MPYINITKSEAGENAGSCADLVAYLEKENNNKKEMAHEKWFDQLQDDIGPRQVQQRIDSNIAKLKKAEAKFFLVNISPSEQELAHIGSDPEKLKTYGRQVMEEYAKNFQKGIEGKDLLYFGKLEYNRYYKYSDEEVKQGKAIRGNIKQGNHMHIQIIVSRKDRSNSRLLSSLNNSSGRNETHSKKFGQFNGVNFKQSCEVAFDQVFDYRRDLQESFAYLNTMKNGSISEKADLISEERKIERNRAKEIEGLFQLQQAEIKKQTAEKEKKEKDLLQEQKKEPVQEKSLPIKEQQDVKQESATRQFKPGR